MTPSPAADDDQARGPALDDDLYRAIGRVAVESSATDEAIREMLSDIIGDFNSAILFEGQSAEWLSRAMRASLASYERMREYDPEELVKASALLVSLSSLRELRNSVIHGNWIVFDNDQWTIEEVIPRPWGGRVKPGERAFICEQSRVGKWGTIRLFTVEDVGILADKFRDETRALIIAFIRMNSNSDVLRGGSFARWARGGVRIVDEAWAGSRLA